MQSRGPATFVVAAAIVAMPLVGDAAAQAGGTPGPIERNWITNATVDRDTTGWRHAHHAPAESRVEWDPQGGRGGSGALHLAGVARDTLSGWASVPGWVFPVDSVPVGRRLHWQAWIRGKSCTGQPMVGAQTYGAGGSVFEASSSEPRPGLSGTFDWSRVEGDLDVRVGCTRVQVVALMSGGGEAWFDDFSLTDAGQARWEDAIGRRAPRLAEDSTYLFLARGDQRVWRQGWQYQRSFTASDTELTRRVRVQFALPRADRHQVPVGLDLWTEPAASLVSASLHEDRLGNVIAELLLDPVSLPDGRVGETGPRKSVLVRWLAPVMVADESLHAVPAHVPLADRWPSEALSWLRPTPCVQSEDPKILAVARELHSGTDDVREIVRRTLFFTRTTFGDAKEIASGFDAVTQLTEDGSCVSHANLVAALLRANGIPARILSGIPTWGGPLCVHFVVEAWLPGHGWYRIESSRLMAPWPASGQVIASVLTSNAEVQGAPRRPAGVGCMSWLSLAEFPDRCNDCHVWGALPDIGTGQVATRLDVEGPGGNTRGRDAALTRARDRWHAWVASGPRPGPDGHLRAPFTASRLDDLLAPAPHERN